MYFKDCVILVAIATALLQLYLSEMHLELLQ